MLKHHMFIFVWIPGATSLPGGSGLLPGSWSSKDAATGSRGDLRKWVHVIFFWGNKTSWRNPGRSDVCVYIMFQTIWFVVLLDSQEGSSATAVKLQNEKPGCSGRGTASGRGVSQKGEGGGDGQNGRCHQMSSYIYILESLECGALDNPNLGSIQSKQAREVAKKIGVCKPN